LTSVLTGPPKAIKVTTRDTGSGLATITVTTHNNATVTVPQFSSGTKSAVVVTGTKINQTLASQVALQVKDVAGNTTNCDPLLATLTSRHASASADLPAAEHLVKLTNGTPGVASVTVTANGHAFTASLGAGEDQTLDIGSAMNGAHNDVTVSASGIGGGSADVLVWDGR
jgi:hypothetical protein